jgi:hypothetical protein
MESEVAAAETIVTVIAAELLGKASRTNPGDCCLVAKVAHPVGEPEVEIESEGRAAELSHSFPVVALQSNPGHLVREPFCGTQTPDERRQLALKPRTELTPTSGDR